MPGEVAVCEEQQLAARPHPHRVHVVAVGPVRGEPPEPGQNMIVIKDNENIIKVLRFDNDNYNLLGAFPLLT